MHARASTHTRARAAHTPITDVSKQIDPLKKVTDCSKSYLRSMRRHLAIIQAFPTLSHTDNEIGGSGPSPGFRSRGDKNYKGAHFLNTTLDVCNSRGPNMKWEEQILNGGQTYPSPHWRRPVGHWQTAVTIVNSSLYRNRLDWLCARNVCEEWRHHR